MDQTATSLASIQAMGQTISHVHKHAQHVDTYQPLFIEMLNSRVEIRTIVSYTDVATIENSQQLLFNLFL